MSDTVDAVTNVIEAVGGLTALISEMSIHLDELELRMQAIERSVGIVPGGNPTEKSP